MWRDYSASKGFRRAVYIAHDVVCVAYAVASKPLERASWSMLLDLPHFGVIDAGRVYRSGLPRTRAHFDQVLSLGIRTLICVRVGGATPELEAFARQNGIRLLDMDVGPDPQYDLGRARRAAEAALDPKHQPVLIHCGGGRHRAGMVVALTRLAKGWSLANVLGEYLHFAQPWPFAENVAFIVSAAQTADAPDAPEASAARGLEPCRAPIFRPFAARRLAFAEL
jgi:protein tyrosine/serine phosphatase